MKSEQAAVNGGSKYDSLKGANRGDVRDDAWVSAQTTNSDFAPGLRCESGRWDMCAANDSARAFCRAGTC